MKKRKIIVVFFITCVILGTKGSAKTDIRVKDSLSQDLNSNTTSSAVTETKKEKQWSDYVTKPKLGGYIIGKYSWNDRAGEKTNGGFDLRLVRLYVDGYCFKDFFYRLQMEVNGSPGTDKGPRIVDAFIEWQRYKFLNIKIGQFKRPFTFENPYNPWDVGMGSYAQAVNILSGMSDYNGEHKSGGRDIGIQIQGDLFPIANEHNLLHYQAGVFNGQGINHTDKDSKKDLIGALWINPLKNLSIGGFGWHGSYANENYTGETNTLDCVDRNRWGIGLKYESLWTARGEYISSEGRSVKNANGGDKADGWYTMVGVPVLNKLKIYGRWDCYRAEKNWATLKTNWGMTANYSFCKNLMLQANYSFTHDRSVKIGKNYNTIDIEVYARF